MTKEALKLALEAAYLAGFNASGEGYNSEYPFDDDDDKPEDDAAWVKRRDDTNKEALAQPQQEPVAWMHEGTLGRYFNENRNDVHSIPLYCAPMTHDSDFIQIPVAYQYAYPDGMWRCSYGDEINGSRPITSRALYARKDGK